MYKEKINKYLTERDPSRIIVVDLIKEVWGPNYLDMIPPMEAHRMKIDAALHLKDLGYEMRLIKTWNKKS